MRVSIPEESAALFRTVVFDMIVYIVHSVFPVSRDIVSPSKSIREMNKSIPRTDYTGLEYPALKLIDLLEIKHRLLMLNKCSINV